MNAPSSRSTSRRLRERILARLLAPPAVGAASLWVAACGGSVTVDDGAGDGAGASGASGTTGGTGATGTGAAGGTSSTGGAGGSPFTCEVTPPPNSELVYECFFASPCPPAGSEEALILMGELLNTSNCADFCCEGENVASVPCGPDPSVGSQCCYYAVVEPYSICEGRPFTIAGEARTAAVAARADWSGRERATQVPSALDQATRTAIAAGWVSDALYEHASVASFARFTLELLAAGAPAHLVRDAQRAAGDEIHHAELCFALATRYGAGEVGPGPLSMEGAELGVSNLRSLLAAVVREGCVGETVAAMVAAEARDAATDPEVVRALGRIAADEARHAELAWRTVAWALSSGDAETKGFVRALLSDPRPTLLASPSSAGADPGALRGAGRLGHAELLEIAERAVREVIRPCADALLEHTPLASARGDRVETA